ncbi:MAG: exodeoxyribonuclease V subunit gamma [Balneolales bacterium]|nr:exodeoxyribonuclease V subunit gamma [Balneolales bacterium]
MLHIIIRPDLKQLYRVFDKAITEFNASGKIGPLDPNRVVVPNKDLQTWLQVQRARESGISANLEFNLPAALINKLNLIARPDYESSLLNKSVMTGLIYRFLQNGNPEPGENSVYNPLFEYLEAQKVSEADAEEQSSLSAYQLAVTISDIFDQYQLFRADWIRSWSSPEENQELFTGPDNMRWQMKLWHHLKQVFPNATDRPDLQENLVSYINTHPEILPPQLHFFATIPQPPAYYHFFSEAARHSDIYIYVCDPAGIFQKNSSFAEAHPFVKLNAHDQTEMLNELKTAAERAVVETDWDLPSGVDAITRKEKTEGEINNSAQLLHAFRQAVSSGEVRPNRWSASDHSVSVHACHSSLREAEIMQDQIIRFLDDHPDASASDVLVVAPNLENYITVVHAVFGQPADESLKMPYHIDDPSQSGFGLMFEAVSFLLGLEQSRFKVQELLGFLTLKPVQEKLGLDVKDIMLIGHWVKETGIRWGANEENRGDQAFFSWKYGIDRLMLGIMEPIGEESVIGEISPYTDIEGEEQTRLAALLYNVFGALNEWLAFSSKPQLIADWAEKLEQISSNFLPDDNEDQKDRSRLLTILGDFRKMTEYFGDDERLPAAMVLEMLESQIRERTAGAGFRKGGITFSTMVPVRHIPFRFIGIFGMDEHSFPGREIVSGFDLMMKNSRAGDRNRRKMNRALFFDALFTAKDRICISYRGFSMKDGSERGHSIVVREFLDLLKEQIEKSSVNEESKAELALPLYKHKMHAFHPDYIQSDASEKNEAAFFTYEGIRAAAAKSAAKASGRKAETEAGWKAVLEKITISQIDKKQTPETESINLQSLISYMQKPVTEYLSKKAGLGKIYKEDVARERDPFKFDGLENYAAIEQLIQHITECLKNDGDADALHDKLYKKLRYQNELPYGLMGKRYFDREFNKFCELIQSGLSRMGEAPQPPDYFTVRLLHPKNPEAEIQISHRISPFSNGKRISFSASKSKPKHHAKEVLQHCFAVIAHQQYHQQPTDAVNSDQTFETYYYCNEGKLNLICCTAADAESLLVSALNIFLDAAAPYPFTPFLMSLCRKELAKDNVGNSDAYHKYFKPEENGYSRDYLIFDDEEAGPLFIEWEPAFVKELITRTEYFWIPLENMIQKLKA